MSMMKQLKRKSVISKLNKLGIHSIEGQPLEDVLYTTLLKTLALKRAADN
ncbi:hypothetical protein [Lysinibacillus pakistanensis]|uniref:Uncharacterized protein n=1 Tax=Lysinibacillus pakistanensis TaxID=759811 RepID=A0AAQ3INE2_9BACI|nr:hypothetical protein [Lysinibacillus pakistanensis]MDM5229677.1 hypothetical protein [Lysinibacillus pakistanensis]MDM5231446.1 hypothetical protein [Lysinibacillus pakistanensis]WHY45283.1 hypothetical protein QNH22_18470 [Lysinibacillus pakistanensis]WHY46993.1 hypothetical protein QNH22_01895 [Lysinibacillus pakistanensis]WHY50291.1 hypothetical protein QNH24_18435 [Lysinibacillus pakistanensis]